MASWYLASVANRTEGWQGVLISGTPSGDGEKLENSLTRLCIPELNTSLHPDSRIIFESFLKGYKHALFDTLENTIYAKLSEAIQPGDLLVSFNCFSLPYNLALTAALQKLTQRRHDFTHLTWSFDLWPFWEEPSINKELWKLIEQPCPRLLYAASTHPVAVSQSAILGIDPQSIQVIPAATEPLTTLRCSKKVAYICRAKRLLDYYPLLYMPVRISARKNIPKAVDIIANLKNHFQNPHLVISASISSHDPTAKEKLSQLCKTIQDNNLLNMVTILSSLDSFDGLVPFDDSMSMVSISDGLLFTSESEGFLIPILEAVLCGVPVFVPKLDTIVSWANNYVISYETSSGVQEIAQAIAKVYRAPQQRYRFEVRTTFSWDAIFDRYFSRIE